MVAYSFQKRFREPILDRMKQQTIRNERKRHARVNETLQLYTGMRTRFCSLIGTATCIGVEAISIHLAEAKIVLPARSIRPVGDVDAFARDDGFEDWPDMAAFWAKGHPNLPAFYGVLVRWHCFLPPPREG